MKLDLNQERWSPLPSSRKYLFISMINGHLCPLTQCTCNTQPNIHVRINSNILTRKRYKKLSQNKYVLDPRPVHSVHIMWYAFYRLYHTCCVGRVAAVPSAVCWKPQRALQEQLNVYIYFFFMHTRIPRATNSTNRRRSHYCHGTEEK